jgi:cytokinin riboside 5'-monophosphate phosphoribohydrolase
MSSTTLSICVFCASASGLPEVYIDAARQLGTEMARRGHRLVYGGGNVGLMREVAHSVHAGGGEVFGAIPRSLVERELAYGPADELVVTETLRERKAEMDAHADAFVALPGGFGTMEELLEVLTLRQLRLHDRPIVLVNANGFWDPFLAMVRGMISQGFAPEGEGFLFEVAKTSEDAIALVEAGHRGAPVSRRAAPPTDALAEDWTAEPA